MEIHVLFHAKSYEEKYKVCYKVGKDYKGNDTFHFGRLYDSSDLFDEQGNSYKDKKQCILAACKFYGISSAGIDFLTK